MRSRTFARRAVAGLAWTALATVAAVVVAAALPTFAGGQTHAVASASMQPALRPGDAVATLPIAPLEAEVGDIVTFPDPGGSGATITHRVEGVDRIADGVAFRTRGDAAPEPEQWRVPADGTIGRVVYRLPAIGHVLDAAGTRAGRTLLLALPAAALVSLALLPGRARATTRTATSGPAGGARP